MQCFFVASLKLGHTNWPRMNYSRIPPSLANSTQQSREESLRSVPINRLFRKLTFVSAVLAICFTFGTAQISRAQIYFNAFALVDAPPINGIVDQMIAPEFAIGERAEEWPLLGGLLRVRLNVQLPVAPANSRLAQATLSLFLQQNSGNSGNATFGPLSLYHNFRSLGISEADYADTNFVLVSSSVVTPNSPAGIYYDVDVTAQISKDYDSDGATAFSDFRFQIDGLQFTDSSHLYRFGLSTSPSPSRLLLTFSPTLSFGFDRATKVLSLSWSTNFSDYKLLSAQNIDATDWTIVTNHSVITNGLFRVEIAPTNGWGFFRLRRE
jgi:hypothetical protein